MATVQEFLAQVDLGELSAVGNMLAADPSLAASHDEQGVSALLHALYRGQRALVPPLRAALTQAGRPLDVFEAAAVGDAPALQAALAADPATATGYSADGFTALHLAAFFAGQVEGPAVARLLVDAGAGVDTRAQNTQQVTPLHSAAAARNLGMARLLLERGADAGARQHGGFTALHAAAQHGDEPLVDVLLAHGVDAGVTADDGRRAADFAAGAGYPGLAERLRTAHGT